MGFWDNIRNAFNNGDNETAEDGYDRDYDDDPAEETTAATPQAPQVTKVSSSVISPANLEMKVCKPAKFDEVAAIANHLMQHKTVVLNLENTNRETALRLIDFLSGVTYAIHGKLKNVASSTYVITPNNVEVTGESAPAEDTEDTSAAKQPREFF